LISTQGAKKDFGAVVANGFAKTAVLDVRHAGVSDRLATNDDAVSQLVTASGASMIILSASKGCQLSEEDAGSGGGRFSDTIDNSLTKQRGAFDLDANGAISVAELNRGLKAEVVRDSKDRQTPWLSRNLTVGDFDIFWALWAASTLARCRPRQLQSGNRHSSRDGLGPTAEHSS
jgi:hypothetical protein